MTYRDDFQLDNLDELRSYVYVTLCESESLVHGAFPMSEQFLVRNGQACGMHFCLHGPRAVKLSAIWETRTSSILFYDSTGRKFQKTQLASGFSLACAAA
jgi:hypothetical protein